MPLLHNLLFLPACKDPLALTHFRLIMRVTSTLYGTYEDLLLCYLTLGQVMAFVNHRSAETLPAFEQRMIRESGVGRNPEHKLSFCLLAPSEECSSDMEARYYYQKERTGITERLRRIFKGPADTWTLSFGSK